MNTEEYNLYYIIGGVYMFIGLISFEWAWASVKSIRKVDEERDRKYPAYRRDDAYQWSKWKFYFGAITLMPLRLISSVLVILFCYIFVRIFTIGHSFRGNTPITGCRKHIINFMYKVFSLLILFFGGMRSSTKQIDFDYSAYLGPDYKKTTNPPNYVSTYISNHSSWLDVPVLIRNLKCAFASKKAFKKTPIFGIIVQSLGCLFISRGATPDKKDKIVEQIGERQQIVEQLGKYPAITVFAEGSTSNGRYLLPFKRGAFAALRAVKPVILKYSYGTLSPAWDVIPFWPLIIMHLSLFDFKCEVIELPTFTPNEYLYSRHADKGKDKWQIYAWAVREVMSAGGDIDKIEASLADKLQYETVLGFRKTKVVTYEKEKEPLLPIDPENIEFKTRAPLNDVLNHE